jgi:hypothetical protein
LRDSFRAADGADAGFVCASRARAQGKPESE